MNTKVKSLLKMETVHSRLMKEQEAQEARVLDDRMKKLEELRRQYKPLSHEDLLKHEEKFLDLKRHKDEDRAKDRQEFASKKYHVPY